MLNQRPPCNLSCPSWTGCGLTHQAIKLGVHRSTPLSKESGVYDAGLEQTLKIQVSYMRKWPKSPWPLFLPHYLPSISPPASLASWGVPYDRLTVKLGPGLQKVLHNKQAPRQSWKLQCYSSLLGHPWRALVKGNTPSGQNYKQRTWLFILLGRKNGRGMNLSNSWAVANSLSRKEHDWKIGDK